jgi:hypothetical protein
MVAVPELDWLVVFETTSPSLTAYTGRAWRRAVKSVPMWLGPVRFVMRERLSAMGSEAFFPDIGRSMTFRSKGKGASWPNDAQDESREAQTIRPINSVLMDPSVPQAGQRGKLVSP